MRSSRKHEGNDAMPVITFALVADSGAARRLRRAVAGTGARTGWLAGTWRELLELTQRAYLLPVLADGWDELFDRALSEMPEAFWAESLAVAPDDTRASVLDALCEILSGSGVGLPDRAARHLRDLADLADRLQEHMPPELALIQLSLRSDAADALHLIRVSQVEGLPRLSRWQQALVDKLNHDANTHAPDQHSAESLGDPEDRETQSSERADPHNALPQAAARRS